MVIAAHPDDEVLGCGGLIAANSAGGGKSTILVVSEGSAAQNDHVPEMMARRDTQLKRAAEILGANRVVHWDYPDMRLDEVPHLELNRRLNDFITDGGYELVFSHHPYDVNRDHQVLHRSVLVACRPTPASPVKGLFTYFVSSSTEWALGIYAERFQANYFLDISDYLDVKLRALKTYEDELREYPHPRSLEAVRDRSRVFGSEMGMPAAEAFHLVFSRERA